MKNTWIHFCLAVSLFLLPVISTTGHIADPKIEEAIKYSYSHKNLIKDQRVIEIDSRVKIINLTKIENQFLFDPIVCRISLYNFSAGRNSTQDISIFYKKIELLLDFPGILNESRYDKTIYPTQSETIADKGVITNTYTKIIDLSLIMGNFRDYYHSAEDIANMRQEGWPVVPVDLRLKLTDLSSNKTEFNQTLLVGFDIFTFNFDKIPEDYFHNDLRINTTAIPEVEFWRGNNFPSKSFQVLIPISLVDFVFETTLLRHNRSILPEELPEIEIIISLLLLPTYASQDFDPPDVSVHHGFTELTRKSTGNWTFDYSLRLKPQSNQFLDLIITNHRGDLDLYVNSVTIVIEAIFYKYSPSQGEKAIALIVAYKYAFIVLGALFLLSVPVYMADHNEEYQRYLKGKGESSEAKVYDRSYKVHPWVPGKTIGRRISGAGSWEWPLQGSSSNETSEGSSDGFSDDGQNGIDDNLTSQNLDSEPLTSEVGNNHLDDRDNESIDALQKMFPTDSDSDQNRNDPRYFNVDQPINDNQNERSSYDDFRFSNSSTQSDSDELVTNRETIDDSVFNESTAPNLSTDHGINDFEEDRFTPQHDDNWSMIGSESAPEEIEYHPWEQETGYGTGEMDHLWDDDGYENEWQSKDRSMMKLDDSSEIREYEDVCKSDRLYYVEPASLDGFWDGNDGSSDFESDPMEEQYKVGDHENFMDQENDQLNDPTSMDLLRNDSELDEYGNRRIIDNLDSDDQSINQDSIFEHANSRELEKENLDSHQQTDYSSRKSTLEGQLDNQKNDYNKQKGQKVIPDVDSIEEIWDYVMDGYSINFIHRLTGIDRSFIFHLIINMIHLNALINSVEQRKEQYQNIDKLRQIEKKQIVPIMSEIYRSLTLVANKLSDDDIERVVKTNDQTVRDESKPFPKESLSENEEPLTLSLSQTNIMDLQAMILSKIAFYAKFNDVGSDMWENGIVLSARNSSGSYKLTVKDILGTLVKNTHVHRQLRSMLPAFKVPNGEYKRSDFKDKQIEDLEPKIRYALESDSLEVIGDIRLESLPVTTFGKIWEKILDVTMNTLSEDQDTSRRSIPELTLKIETSNDLDQGDVIDEISSVDTEVSIDLAIDPTKKIEVSRHQPSLEVLPISTINQTWERGADSAIDLKKNQVKEEVVESLKFMVRPVEDNTKFRVLSTLLVKTIVPFNRTSFKQIDSISEFEKYRKSHYIELNTLSKANLKNNVGLSFESVVRMGFMSLVYWATQSKEFSKSTQNSGFEIFTNLEIGKTFDSTQDIMSQVPGSIKLHEYLGFHKLEIDPQEQKTLKLMYNMLLKHWNSSNDYLLNIDISLYRDKIYDIITNDDFTKFFGVTNLSNYQFESFHECYDQLMARAVGNYFISMVETPDRIQNEFFKYPWMLRYHPRLVNNWIEISHNPTGMDRIIHIPYSDDISDIYFDLPYTTIKYELKQHKSFRKSSIVTGGDLLEFISTPLSNSMKNYIIRNGLPLSKLDYLSTQKIDKSIINSLPNEAFLNYTGAQLERYLGLSTGHSDPINSLLISTEGVGINFFDRLRRDSNNIGLGREFQLSRNIWGIKHLRLDTRTGLYRMRVGKNYKEFVGSQSIKEKISIHVNPLPLNEKLSVDLLNAVALLNPKISQPYAVFDVLTGKWMLNPSLQSGELYDLMVRDARFQLAIRELEIHQNQLAELANTGRLVEFGDRPSLLNTLGADLPYNLTLTNSLVKGKKGFTGVRISKYGSSSNYIIMEFLMPQIKYFQVAHPTFKAKIGPEIFQEPRITILPRTKIKADLGSFRLGLVSYDFITQEWDALDGIEQTLIINAYGHDLWDADKILVKYLSNSNFDLQNYVDNSSKPTWMAIIKEYKILRERSLTQKCEQEEIDIFNAFKLFHEDISQPDSLWNRINNESPEFARAMIVDLYNRFSGKFRGLGLSLSESSSWNNIITDSTVSKKVIGNILEYSGPASHELLKKSDEIHDLINDPRQIKHYDEFTIDSISANSELLTSRRNTKFQETYATIFQQSLLDLERILLLDDYSSTFLWPKRMGTKNDRIGLVTSKPNDRWTSQLIKDAKRKYNDMLKQIWGSKNNIKKPIRLTKQEYEEVVRGFMNLLKPGDYYMDSFKTHSEYKKKIKNGLTLDDLSLARPGTVDMAGIKLTLKNNSLSPQVVVTNVELLLNNLKKYIFTSEGAAGSTMIKNLPAFESPELWASFLGRCYYVDHTTGAYGPVPLYNEITDPPLRFTVEMRGIHNIMFNLDKLLLKKDSNGSPAYGTNGGINPKMIRNSLANDGVWLYYMVLLENAIESGRPWQSIQEARKDPEFLKSVNIWKNTSLIKNPDGSGSHILFKDFGEKPFWSIFPNFERSRYKSIAEYIAYHVNYKKIANMHAKTDETGEILFYYFRASQYENSFLNMNWNGPSSKLPYYLPTNQTNNFIGLRDTLLEVKNQFSNNLFDADWISWSLKNLPDSNELSTYLWLRFMDIISKLMVEDPSE